MIDATAARARNFARLRDENVATARGRQERDAGVLRDGVFVARVARVRERAVREREDHAAVADAVSVQHVIAQCHADARETFARFVDCDASRASSAFALQQCLGDALCELVCFVHASLVN